MSPGVPLRYDAIGSGCMSNAGAPQGFGRRMLITPNSYRRAWAEWLPTALPLLEEEKYADALKAFPQPPPGEPPVFRIAPSTAERRIAFVTSGGHTIRKRRLRSPSIPQSAT